MLSGLSSSEGDCANVSATGNAALAIVRPIAIPLDILSILSLLMRGRISLSLHLLHFHGPTSECCLDSLKCFQIASLALADWFPEWDIPI